MGQMGLWGSDRDYPRRQAPVVREATGPVLSTLASLLGPRKPRELYKLPFSGQKSRGGRGRGGRVWSRRGASEDLNL